MKFVPKRLQQWVHPDTLILYSFLGCASCYATYLGVRTLFKHTEINIQKGSPWKWRNIEQNTKVGSFEVVKKGKATATTDRNISYLKE